ncbi:hypothetical protein SPRG_19662 [Saprolegnia parasitica CBS 223.65]|uniref:Uncharacterized protein n=1 Tax=Saprolegnia parasitica (strain CBS 223.65) TaxID=695850 RepID=A0A067CUZ2_SAPPC|nr:hypothetical protein SPRG_19662 [Saprolegnia parasitica CBS 223.65]KDO30597.1 hypothetical protein SPRG_19662 [Saprolegnia parasitica CBS 223.65]|eukprot:XP_012198882.1 hypothetical protein SPRG_19662 [Saprolegnia parasitica CBS 223.65]
MDLLEHERDDDDRDGGEREKAGNPAPRRNVRGVKDLVEVRLALRLRELVVLVALGLVLDLGDRRLLGVDLEEHVADLNDAVHRVNADDRDGRERVVCLEARDVLGHEPVVELVRLEVRRHDGRRDDVAEEDRVHDTQRQHERNGVGARRPVERPAKARRLHAKDRERTKAVKAEEEDAPAVRDDTRLEKEVPLVLDDLLGRMERLDHVGCRGTTGEEEAHVNDKLAAEREGDEEAKERNAGAPRKRVDPVEVDDVGREVALGLVADLFVHGLRERKHTRAKAGLAGQTHAGHGGRLDDDVFLDRKKAADDTDLGEAAHDHEATDTGEHVEGRRDTDLETVVHGEHADENANDRADDERFQRNLRVLEAVGDGCKLEHVLGLVVFTERRGLGLGLVVRRRRRRVLGVGVFRRVHGCTSSKKAK